MPTYCTLQDAYGPNWNSKQLNTNNTNKELIKKEEEKKEKAFQTAQQPSKGQGESSFCPHCNNCLEQNNKFQQKVIETAMRPLPRWTPQTQNINPWDPYNRYFAPKEEFGNFNYRENFGDINVQNGEKLIQLILYLLIALFVIQLAEFVVSLGSENK